MKLDSLCSTSPLNLGDDEEEEDSWTSEEFLNVWIEIH